MKLVLLLILPFMVSINAGLRSYSKSYSGYSGDEGTHVPNLTSRAWTGNPREYTIGGVLSGIADIEHFFRQTLSDVEQLKLKNVVSLNEATQTMDTNPIKTAITVCSQLIQRQVYAIIVSKPKQGDLSPASVSYTAGFYHIPVIGISSRDSAFSDKNIHVSFLRTVPPYSHQADVWVEMLKQFKYRQLVFIHSSDTDGRALLGRFQTKTQDLQTDDQEVKVEKVEEFEPGRHSYLDTLLKIKECQARVYFLYASTSDADQLFQDAKRLNMTGSGYVWIVTEQALESPHVPSGTLGIQLVGASNERGHISDSLNILAQALLELHKKENVTEAPSNCNTSGALWQTGKKLFEYIRNQVLPNGATGHVAFDSMGDRIYAEYQIINIQDDPRNNFVNGVIVGNYQYSNMEGKMRLQLDEDRIIWPGGSSQKPTGLMIPTHLKVLTILEKPFVYARHIQRNEACDGTQGEILCPHYNTKLRVNDDSDRYCCRGYCIDMLKLLSETCNFTYSLHLSFNDYGALERNNITGKQEWTGLIGELVNEKADLIVAPLTINPERAQVMEFSKPFKYQGITILQKRQPRASQLVSFLQPFKSTLWVLVLVSVHVVAMCLYLLDRFSPFGRSGSPVSRDQKEESLNLTSAIWFAWGVLLNSGIGEGTPRSFSARVLGMVWAGFAMIIVASYTANLAAFLVLDKPQTSLTGINDPRLRNPMENFTYATVKGSAVDMYFRRQVELSNMYRTMEGKHYKSPEEAIDAVKSGALKAFIWDSSRLEFEAARDCDLITAGDLFGRSGYGVGLQKGSPWADKVTLAILDFHESGKMEDLDNTWILLNNEVDCRNNDDNSPATLGLKNMRGVFILVGLGIIGGLGLIVIEIIYKKHQLRKQKTVVSAKRAVKKWRGTIEKRRTLRSSKEENKNFKSNGIRLTTAETPESITLSVDSLPRKDSGLPGPRQEPTITGTRKESIISAQRKEITVMRTEQPILPVQGLPPRRESSPMWLRSSPKEPRIAPGSMLLIPEPPPPVPPHKTPPVLDSRPKSALSSVRKCASREDLTEPISNCVAISDRALHHSVGSELPTAVDHYCEWQRQQLLAQKQPRQLQMKTVKSPSSSDSSRKHRTTATTNHRDLWSSSAVPPYISSSNRKDELSSPECPSVSTSSELRQRIPVPPPPPKLYWQNQQQQAHPSSVVVTSNQGRRHTKDFVVRRNQYVQQPPSSHVFQGHRRHHRMPYAEDSDV